MVSKSEKPSYKSHEAFLERLPFMHDIKLHGEEPTFQHFVHHDVNPLSGNTKDRNIYAPNDPMRAVHKRLIRAIGDLNIPMPSATGGVKGGSPARNLMPHADNRYFYLLDLKAAYAQVDIFSLAHILVGYGLEADVRDIELLLEQYCSVPESPGLCTGAPSSPLLFNIGCLNLDNNLQIVCNEYGLTYTRYIDDLTFSSADSKKTDDRIGKHKRSVIRKVIEDQGLLIHDRKTKILDLDFAPVIITGLQLNRSGKWQLPSRYFAIIEREFSSALDDLSFVRFPLDDIRWAELAGLYGLLKSAIDKSRGTYTQRELDLLDDFQKLRKIQRIRTRKSRRV